MAKTKAKAKKKSVGTRYATQVGAESTLKFGPEESSLAQQLRDSQKQYEGDVSVAHGTRAAIQQAAATAKPALTGDYKTALGTVKDTKTTLAADLAKLPGAGALAGASARDAAGTTRRLAEALASSKAETDSRARDAVSGEAFAVSNARSKRSDTREKITAREQSLAQEKGAFAQGRSGELVEAARGRSVTRRGQDKTSATARAERRTQNKNTDAAQAETERHNKAAEKIAAENAAGKKKKKADPKATEKFSTEFTRAKSNVDRVRNEVSTKDKAAGKTERARSETAGIVVQGRPGQTVTNDSKGNPLPNPVKIPAVKASEQLATSVALDIAYDGHVSTANLKRLHALGVSVRQLGIPTAGRSGTSGAKKPATSVVPQVTKNPYGVTSPLSPSIRPPSSRPLGALTR